MEKERTARENQPPPKDQHAQQLARTPRPAEGDAFLAHSEDTQPRVPGEGEDLPAPFGPDPGSVSLDRAMRLAREPWRPGAAGELDADLLAAIDAIAGRDWREQRRLIEGAKRYPVVREQIRNPAARSRLATSAPDFTPPAGRPRKPE